MPVRRIAVLVAAALFNVLLLGACVFGGDSKESSQVVVTPSPAIPHLTGSRPVATPTTPARASTSLVTVGQSQPFVWPAQGPITSFMGAEHPDGIDIGLDAGGSRDIHAVATGKVVFAGGGDDEPLGLSIVIDHGDGVTSTYGHLSELRVEPDDSVSQGALVGIGGSTGVSTGDHLHLEIRVDGATVDPLTVLPVDDAVGVARKTIDCTGESPVFPAGSTVSFDFAPLLGPQERLFGAKVTPQGDSPELKLLVSSPKGIQLGTPLDLDGPEREDLYMLHVTIDSPFENFIVACSFAVQVRIVPTVFFVRAGPAEVASNEEQPKPTPTPTPLPGPRYSAPVIQSAGVSSPVYDSPGTNSPQVGSPQFLQPVP